MWLKRCVLTAVGVALCAVGALAVYSQLASSQQAPAILNYQGALADSQGTPITQQVIVYFRLYDAAIGGTLLWEEPHVVTPGIGGVFNVSLGEQTPFSTDLFQNEPALYLGIQVGNNSEMIPRQRVVSTPYALVSQVANQTEQVSDVPSGMIAMFEGSCPLGWTRVSALDGRVPRGAATFGATGGSATHAHSETPHTHSVTGSTGGASRGDTSAGGQWFTSDRGDPEWQHRHDVNLTTSSSGGGNTGAASSWPPYIEVVFCRKD